MTNLPRFDERLCPLCGAMARADFVDIGVGLQQCTPFACEAEGCGWVEARLEFVPREDTGSVC